MALVSTIILNIFLIFSSLTVDEKTKKTKNTLYFKTVDVVDQLAIETTYFVLIISAVLETIKNFTNTFLINASRLE
jgi:hypothetical protein